MSQRDPQAFLETILAALKEQQTPLDALRNAGHHLGDVGDVDAIARVTVALVRDFETETHASMQRDGNVLARVAEGYVRAAWELRAASSYELTLPFLAATVKGPVHYARRLTQPLIAELLARPT